MRHALLSLSNMATMMSNTNIPLRNKKTKPYATMLDKWTSETNEKCFVLSSAMVAIAQCEIQE